MAYNTDLGRQTKSVTSDGILRVTGAIYSSGADSIGSDRETVATAGVPVQLQDHDCKLVVLTAETDNAGNIFVGDSSVSASAGSEVGFVLYTGQTSIPLPISNTNLIYIDSTVSGDGVAYTYIN